jgi:hypothetical protein
MIMRESEFWDLIDSARRSVSLVSEMPKWLVDHLKEMTISEIVDFGCLSRAASIAAYDDRLWAAAYAILGGCSDDSFSDFRDWLIAQGKQCYDRTLVTPDCLAEIEHFPTRDQITILGFSFGSVPFNAYKAKTGLKDFSERMGVLPPSAWRLKNEGIWEDNEESLKRVVPRLYARFGSKA